MMNFSLPYILIVLLERDIDAVLILVFIIDFDGAHASACLQMQCEYHIGDVDGLVVVIHAHLLAHVHMVHCYHVVCLVASDADYTEVGYQG